MKKRDYLGIIRLLMILAVDIAMVVMEAEALSFVWTWKRSNQYRYYTNDSNILAMAVCAVSALCTVVCLLRRNFVRPQWIRRIKHVAASCLMVTFLVAACVLVPLECAKPSRFWREFRDFMLRGDLLYLHTVCPLLLFAEFLLLETGKPLKGNVWVCLIPTLIYGVITLYKNYTRAYIGPYPFLYIYIQPVYMTIIWMIVIVGGAEMIAWGTHALNQCVSRLYRRLMHEN